LAAPCLNLSIIVFYQSVNHSNIYFIIKVED